MKNQKGFTLIELLLVLAIIGIISAIAIPALLNQRARARDKSAMQNTVSRVAEIASQIDQLNEAQVPAGDLADRIGQYITTTTGAARNPWAGKGGAPNQAINPAVTDFGAGASANKDAFDLALAGLAGADTLGQGQFGFQLPSAVNPGFCGGAVYVYTPNTGTLPNTQVVFSSVAIE